MTLETRKLNSFHNDSDLLKALKDFIEKNKDKTDFLEHEVKWFLKDMGISVPKGRFIKIGEEIPQQLDLKYPLVTKVSSRKITSKSDVNGVRIGLKSEDELKKSVAELQKIEYAEGVLIEEMASPGLEVIVGGIIDAQFGPVVMFGLGGFFVELFKDVAFALAPFKNDTALWLIEQIKGYKLLEGYRGKTPVDIATLMKIIVTVSELIATGLIKEIDLNPVVLYSEEAVILDAKMLIIS